MPDRHNMVPTVKTMLVICTQSVRTQGDCFLLHVTSDCSSGHAEC